MPVGTVSPEGAQRGLFARHQWLKEGTKEAPKNGCPQLAQVSYSLCPILKP